MNLKSYFLIVGMISIFGMIIFGNVLFGMTAMFSIGFVFGATNG